MPFVKTDSMLEDHKKRLRQERRLAREAAIEESIEIWETSILQDWNSALRDPKRRKIWWNGIPPKLRGIAWEKAIGNPLALNKGTCDVSTFLWTLILFYR